MNSAPLPLIYQNAINILAEKGALDYDTAMVRGDLLKEINTRMEESVVDRTMRDAISYGVSRGEVPIILSRNSGGGGYFLSSSAEEIRRSHRTILSYAIAHRTHCLGLKRALRNADRGQQRLF